MDDEPATTEPLAPDDSVVAEPVADLDVVEDRYVPVSDLVTGLVVDDGQVIDEDVGLVVTLEKIATEFPIELRIEHGESGLRLTTAPPTQHVETTILPVWHQLRVTIVRDSEDDAGS